MFSKISFVVVALCALATTPVESNLQHLQKSNREHDNPRYLECMNRCTAGDPFTSENPVSGVTDDDVTPGTDHDYSEEPTTNEIPVTPETGISVPGESCAEPCGITEDIEASFTDFLLLLINLSEDIAHDFAILLAEVYRSNLDNEIRKSTAAIIGLIGSDDLRDDFDVFIDWVCYHEDIEASDGLRDIVNGNVSGLGNMLTALRNPDVGKNSVDCEGIAYLFLPYLGGFRTSYAKYPNDPEDEKADADFVQALEIKEAISMYRSFKYFKAGDAEVWEFVTTGVPASERSEATRSRPAHKQAKSHPKQSRRAQRSHTKKNKSRSQKKN